MKASVLGSEIELTWLDAFGLAFLAAVAVLVALLLRRASSPDWGPIP